MVAGIVVTGVLNSLINMLPGGDKDADGITWNLVAAGFLVGWSIYLQGSKGKVSKEKKTN